MEYKRINNQIIFRLDPNDEIISFFSKIAEKENIKAGFIEAIGATNNFTLGTFNTLTKEYEFLTYKGDHEILSLNGNITRRDNNPHIHLHMICSSLDSKIIGGHLKEGYISITLEGCINIIDYELSRELNKTFDVYKMTFKK